VSALLVLAVLFCAMALLGLVRLVRELLIDHTFDAPAISCETAETQAESQQDAPQNASSAH
jgi:hypothetical protein